MHAWARRVVRVRTGLGFSKASMEAPLAVLPAALRFCLQQHSAAGFARCIQPLIRAANSTHDTSPLLTDGACARRPSITSLRSVAGAQGAAHTRSTRRPEQGAARLGGPSALGARGLRRGPPAAPTGARQARGPRAPASSHHGAHAIVPAQHSSQRAAAAQPPAWDRRGGTAAATSGGMRAGGAHLDGRGVVRKGERSSRAARWSPCVAVLIPHYPCRP